jgi:hypothetical protein
MMLREIYQDIQSKSPRVFPESAGKAVSARAPVTPEYEEWLKENFGAVQISPPVEHSKSLRPETQLVRFMDLPKFLDFLVNRRLRLPRLGSLKKIDPRECHAVPTYEALDKNELLKRLRHLKEFAPESAINAFRFEPLDFFVGSRDSFESYIQKLELPALREALWFLEHTRLCQELYCSCWYGSEMESDAMWKIYCQSVGVAVTTTVSRLKSAISCMVPRVLAEHVKLMLAEVQYDDGRICDSSTLPWLIKRKAFRHEDEVRLFIDYPAAVSGGFDLRIEPAKFIKEITVTPYAPKWQSEAIEKMIERLEPTGRNRLRKVRAVRRPFDVRQSEHLEAADPQWPQLPGIFPGFGAM